MIHPLKFTVAFDPRDHDLLLKMWSKILSSSNWSEGEYTKMFESEWATWNQLPAVAFSSWSGAALAALEYIDVRNAVVLCPANTYMATPLSVIQSGGHVEFVDCNKSDLCMSFEDFREKAERFKPKAAWLVHIGGHIAFDVELIAEYCRQNKIWLLEDCAHAHGAEWSGRRPGSWGDAGVYSFYATKTISTGEGGMLVSKHPDLLALSKRFRNYGRPDYQHGGLNFRLTEFTAALGIVQTRRLNEIVTWKQSYAHEILDKQYRNRVILPPGMQSGYYKYIVFDHIETSTGKVYQTPCHHIMNREISLPNTEFISKNHWCVPIYYPRDMSSLKRTAISGELPPV